MTLRNILEQLNQGLTPPEWVEDLGVRVMPIVVFDPARGVSFDLSKGVVVKLFINVRTGEIKTYLAKSIEDLPERSRL